MANLVKLTEELYDRRDPARPAVFLAPKNALVDKAFADKFDGKYDAPAATKARKEADVENKAVKPAETKTARSKKA